MAQTPKIRLYVDHSLADRERVVLSRDQAHYLFGVMRLRPGDAVALINGRDGEWHAEVAEASKRGGALVVGAQLRALQVPPDLWLLFAPIKKARTDFIVEKAAEMGVAHILPVGTDFTNAERIRRDRLQAHVIEAVEQCGGTFVPEVADLQPLAPLLAAWPKDRHLIFADEALVGTKKAPPPRAETWAILIGPEGGFSEAERARLHAMPWVTPISLGPRILRADTAAVAALTLFQAQFGDWQ
ncbi:MAG: 16S rRNA (uracil(1498)-N(3))-methyltransferase [Pseudomonadota bacterium]